MQLINSKSILICNEYEEEIHNKEINDFIEQIYKFENYDCALVINRIDIKGKEVIEECKLHQILNSIEYVDIKKGVDLYINDGFIVFVCYGQAYLLNGERGIVSNKIQVLPFNNKREFIRLY